MRAMKSIVTDLTNEYMDLKLKLLSFTTLLCV